MEIEFAGAAREVTGSCHILRVNGKTIVLDCGMFQGRRSESTAKNKALPLPVSEIDAIVLSHAHIDHSGRLPFLVSQGYRGTIFATAATRDLCAVMLADSAHIQENDARHLARRNKSYVEPLYTMEDAVQTMKQLVGYPYNKPFDVLPGVRCTFVDAGHILGSASVLLDITENGATKRLVFSGDIGRGGLSIIRDPIPPTGADVVIMESTYGNREHQSVETARADLAAVVRDTAARGGRIIIPAFAVGRTQELVYTLHGLAREGAIPSIPIFVDSPLAIDTTTVFELHPEVFDQSEAMVRQVDELFRFPLLTYTRDTEESKALNTRRGPMIVIAASGMAEAGRVLHHLQHGAGNPNNTILIVGFQGEGTLGRRIVERVDMLRIFGDDVPLRAQVKVLNGYSAHADRHELANWLLSVKKTSPALQHVFLVHGEPEAQDEFATDITPHGFKVTIPSMRDRVTV